MSRKVRLRATAQADVDGIVAYLSAKAGAAVARRFRAAFRETLKFIAAHPGVGRARSLSPLLPGLRSRVVTDFDNYVVFYQPADDAIDVVHVVYGGRDIDEMFRDDPDPA